MIAQLELGRDAVRRHAWEDGVEALEAADREHPLAPDDLELLGTAMFWTGSPDGASDALERAFERYRADGLDEDAARVALWLSYHAFRRLNGAIGGGWMAQAKRLLDGLPESPLHGFMAAVEGQGELMAGRVESGLARLDEAMRIGRERGSANALYVAMGMRGMGLLMSGRWQEALTTLDEAAAAAAAGGLDLRCASDIFCMTMAASREVGDLERAAQWTDQSDRWMHRQGAGGYPGVCRVYRAELKMLHGQWPEAEHEARQACDELQRFGLLDEIGAAHNAVGEVRLRMGDLDGASEAFDRAYEYGHQAQPGSALLLLARGQVDDARRSIDRVLSAGTSAPADGSARSRLLPALVEISIAAGDLAAARLAVEELEGIAAKFERPLFRAGALTARGELLLGEDKPSEASPILGRSWRLWQTTDLPYEAARARLHYAEALAAEGDALSARRDLSAARAVFERLGATLDLQHVDRLLGGVAGSAPSTATHARVIRTFMFTDIVTSTDLVGMLGDEAWIELLGWHDRELRATFGQHHGDVVSHTGDGFFVAFERSADAIDCAIEIQRRLARHRRDHGFAPFVRIGLHTAEATRRGTDYGGQGVHIAARVGAAATRDEILATTAALAEIGEGRYDLSEIRSLTLKGVAESVEARSVEWGI